MDLSTFLETQGKTVPCSDVSHLKTVSQALNEAEFISDIGWFLEEFHEMIPYEEKLSLFNAYQETVPPNDRSRKRFMQFSRGNGCLFLRGWIFLSALDCPKLNDPKGPYYQTLEWLRSNIPLHINLEALQKKIEECEE